MSDPSNNQDSGTKQTGSEQEDETSDANNRDPQQGHNAQVNSTQIALTPPSNTNAEDHGGNGIPPPPPSTPEPGLLDPNTSTERPPKTSFDFARPLLSLAWPWSSNRSSVSSDDFNEADEDNTHASHPGSKPLFSWPWSHTDIHHGERSTRPNESQGSTTLAADKKDKAPLAEVKSSTAAPPPTPQAQEPVPPKKKPLLAITWPWSANERPPQEATLGPTQPSNVTVVSRKGTNEDVLPPQETVPPTPPPRRKPILSVSWPWSSTDTKSPDNQQQPRTRESSVSQKSPQEVSSLSRFVSPLTNIKWPWSSSQSAPELSPKDQEDSAKAEPAKPTTAPHHKASKTFSSQMADFVRKSLPEKILAISPWGQKPAEDKKKHESSLRDPSGFKTHAAFHHEPAEPKKARVLPSKKRYSLVDDDDLRTSSSSSLSSLGRVDSFTLVNEHELLSVTIPEHLRHVPVNTRSPESNWDNAFHHLAALAATDERYQPVPIQIFRDKMDHPDLHSDSSEEGSRVPSTMNLTYIPDARRSLPFLYAHRPFRLPRLAKLATELDDDASPTIFQFDPIRVTSTEWSNIHPGSDSHLAAMKWTLPEPIRADKRLLPQIDPLVKYKLKRLGKSQVTPEEMLQKQEELELGITPSGRKLDGYSSGSGDECTYKRVLCRNDSDFDLVQPYVETESGDKWPHPFLNYWNWKRIDKNANEEYLNYQRPDKDDYLAQKRKIAEQLEEDPFRIPYQNLGADDTDYEDPLGPLSGTPAARVLDKLLLKMPKYLSRRAGQKRTSGSGDGVGSFLEDPIYRRYPYLLMQQYTKSYQKYYQFELFRQAQKRRLYRLYLGMLGKYTSTCATMASDPCWFFTWKHLISRVIRIIPRKCKLDKETETVFYGTFASLFATQYIVEYDLLPNMDDPVGVSQLALEKALQIKEEFFNYSKNGTGPASVNYIKMQRSKTYEKYMECIGMLCRYQPIKMPPRVRKAFFLNYFNVLSIQTQILRIPEREQTMYLWEIKNFWSKTKGLAGFMELSLEEIYHGILRCNRMHPTKQVKMFEEGSTKGLPKEMNPLRLSLDWMDPRIHFALSVGCKSCPSIHSFSLYEQDLQLDEVARTYVRNRVKVNVDFRVVTLPILFLWYERDFGNNKYIMLWYLKQFMVSKDMLKVRQLLTSGKSINFRYERFDYEIDHTVRRHPVTKFGPIARKKIVPLYWGSKF